MMTPEEKNKATRYNEQQSGDLWVPSQLPANIGGNDPGGGAFARAVYMFQEGHGLKADGMLGPKTLGAIKGDPTQKVAPDAPAPSNAIVLGGKSVSIPQEMVDAGFVCTNFKDDGIVHFKARKRTGPVMHLVIHESVTTSRETTVKILEKRDLGVHLIVGADGSVSCHADLLTEAPAHGNQLNRASVGLEVVSPYYEKNGGGPWSETIPAQWWTHVPKGQPREYVKPTDAQMDCLDHLVEWLTEIIETLPFEFPTSGLSSKSTRIKGWKEKAKPGPGVVAHRD